MSSYVSITGLIPVRIFACVFSRLCSWSSTPQSVYVLYTSHLPCTLPLGWSCHHRWLCFSGQLSRDFTLSAQFWDRCLPACDETKYSTELSSSLFPSYELIRNEAFSDIFKAILTRMCVALLDATQEQSVSSHCHPGTVGKLSLSPGNSR